MKGHAPLWLLGEIQEVIRPKKAKEISRYQVSFVKNPLIHRRETIKFIQQLKPQSLYLRSTSLSVSRRDSMKLPIIPNKKYSQPETPKDSSNKVIQHLIDKPRLSKKRPTVSFEHFKAEQWKFDEESTNNDLQEYIKSQNS